MANKELRKMIGQMFLCGFEGRSVTPHVKDLVSRFEVAGLIFFSRNISEPGQVWELIRSLKANDLLHAIDHEGGRVVRLGAPVTHFPPLSRLGDHNSPDLAFKAAAAQGTELAALGFNLAFAPVLDVLTNPLNRVIGDRALSSDPKAAAALGAEFVRGLQSTGVAACGKHFPGHGDTREDSHETLPKVRGSDAALSARELLPFRAAIAAGVRTIMTAHVLYEDVDPVLPATLSPKLIQALLRDRLKFDGVVVTDDLEMKGVASGFDVEDRTLLAIKAGADLLLFCHTPEVQVAALETVYRAVDGRIIRPERIEQSWRRIQALKAAVRGVKPAANRDALYAALSNPEHKALAASLT